MVINDKRHRELMTKYIEHTEQISKENFSDMRFEIEKPYNHYGSRGFIDILFTFGNYTTSICEVKPVLNNLGEALRQLRRAHEAILNNAIKDYQINDHIYLRLVTEFSEENVKIIRNSYPILKNVKELIIDLYCGYNNEFYLITSIGISNYMIKKYGDPLLHRWEMCKNKESDNDMEALQRAKIKHILENNR